ncbi:hypothetical protein F5050DRAFT_1810274 [Lentinula boryana]|uniref:Uncharacterized protein n=1 Tax=Lentinula boryana TaxID=40481 RepID=A0ABQ8Q5D2_9AGAR|nr:hypothetical protein F5050DRAFT_1810274 [Lentinula boryana]
MFTSLRNMLPLRQEPPRQMTDDMRSGSAGPENSSEDEPQASVASVAAKMAKLHLESPPQLPRSQLAAGIAALHVDEETLCWLTVSGRIHSTGLEEFWNCWKHSSQPLGRVIPAVKLSRPVTDSDFLRRSSSNKRIRGASIAAPTSAAQGAVDVHDRVQPDAMESVPELELDLSSLRSGKLSGILISHEKISAVDYGSPLL